MILIHQKVTNYITREIYRIIKSEETTNTKKANIIQERGKS